MSAAEGGRWRVVLTGAAVDDLRRIGPVLAPRVLQHVLALEGSPDAGVPLLDRSTGFLVLSAEGSRWRLVYSVARAGAGEVVTVHELWVDGARLDGEAYAEALDRMQGADQPDVVQLARILRRLGRITGTVPVPRNRLRAPVPDWLADALVTQAAVDPLTVAAMDARSAFELWNTALPRRTAGLVHTFRSR
jgi:mRNA interferase RelE/StbE